MSAFDITHFGSVVFSGGAYRKASGSANWTVQPVPGFGQDIGPPLGQIRIVFAAAVAGNYAVLVTPCRTENTPLLTANYGNDDRNGFVVHLFDPVASKTLQNGSFSFAVVIPS